MELHKDKPGKKYNVSFWIMLFCIFCFTIGQFIPIYFVNANLREKYYFIILILLVLSSSRTMFKRTYRPERNNITSARLISIIVGFAALVTFGFLTLAFYFGVWTQANIIYVKKDNPNIKIISRYVNEGAFGGGTEPEDYQVVLHRPILFLFKMETTIDTTNVDKQIWKKQKN